MRGGKWEKREGEIGERGRDRKEGGGRREGGGGKSRWARRSNLHSEVGETNLIISSKPFSELQDEPLGNEFPCLRELGVENGHQRSIHVGKGW